MVVPGRAVTRRNFTGVIYVLHNAPSQPPRQWPGFPAFGVDDPIVAVRGPSWCRLVHRGVNWGYA